MGSKSSSIPVLVCALVLAAMTAGGCARAKEPEAPAPGGPGAPVSSGAAGVQIEAAKPDSGN